MDQAAAGGAEPDYVPCIGIPPDLDVSRSHESVMFSPPLYIQRYTTVCRLLADTERSGVVSKVVDIGCSEMTFLQYLKSVGSLTDISLLDVSEETLRRHLPRAAPGVRDRLERRMHPLRVRVFCGDVTQPDARLRDCDAVTGIEVIEHMEPAVLQAMPAVLFGYMRPRLVVLTTPNAEFNVLFHNFSGMRHWDHKFEWTRSEFQHWCGAVVAEYPEYQVSFEDIGRPPAGSEHLGGCSQMAVFFRRAETAAPAPATAAAAADDAPQPHRLLSERQFPFATREDRLVDDALFWTRQIAVGRLAGSLQPRREEFVSLRLLADLPFVREAGGSLDELEALLRTRGEPLVARRGEVHVVYREPPGDGDGEEELAGGDRWPTEAAPDRGPAAGADAAAGDAHYHEDWDNEPDWEQEIRERLRLGRTGRPRPGVM